MPISTDKLRELMRPGIKSFLDLLMNGPKTVEDKALLAKMEDDIERQKQLDKLPYWERFPDSIVGVSDEDLEYLTCATYMYCWVKVTHLESNSSLGAAYVKADEDGYKPCDVTDAFFPPLSTEYFKKNGYGVFEFIKDTINIYATDDTHGYILHMKLKSDDFKSSYTLYRPDGNTGYECQLIKSLEGGEEVLDGI